MRRSFRTHGIDFDVRLNAKKIGGGSNDLADFIVWYTMDRMDNVLAQYAEEANEIYESRRNRPNLLGQKGE